MAIRILHLISSLDFNGSNRQLAHLCGDLVADTDIHVCSLGGGGPAVGWFASNLSAERLHLRSCRRTYVDRLCWLVTVLRRLHPDVLHTWPGEAQNLGRLAAAMTGVRVLVTSCRTVTERTGVLPFPNVSRRFWPFTERIVANSELAAATLVNGGVSPHRVVVIENCVDPRIQSTVHRERRLRSELKLPPGHRIVAAVGPLFPEKKIKDLIWATDLLKVVRDDLHLLIIGSGPHQQRLKQFMRHVGNQDRVIFLGDRLDLPDLMPVFDCLWLASRSESMNNALMEAMASGRPVVVSDIAANRALVKDGVSGMLVPVGHRAGYARCTQWLLSHPEAASRLGDGARAAMAQRSQTKQMAAQYRQLYQSLTGNAVSSPPHLRPRAAFGRRHASQRMT